MLGERQSVRGDAGVTEIGGSSWATPAEIALAEDEHGRPLPAAYVALVTVRNGGFTPSSLSILEVEEIVQRNAD